MKEEKIDYSKAAASPAFQELLKRKRAFIVPMTVFFLLFYFLLPILTSYFTFLNQPAMRLCYMGVGIRDCTIHHDVDAMHSLYKKSRTVR